MPAGSTRGPPIAYLVPGPRRHTAQDRGLLQERDQRQFRIPAIIRFPTSSAPESEQNPYPAGIIRAPSSGKGEIALAAAVQDAVEAELAAGADHRSATGSRHEQPFET